MSRMPKIATLKPILKMSFQQNSSFVTTRVKKDEKSGKEGTETSGKNFQKNEKSEFLSIGLMADGWLHAFSSYISCLAQEINFYGKEGRKARHVTSSHS